MSLQYSWNKLSSRSNLLFKLLKIFSTLFIYYRPSLQTLPFQLVRYYRTAYHCMILHLLWTCLQGHREVWHWNGLCEQLWERQIVVAFWFLGHFGDQRCSYIFINGNNKNQRLLAWESLLLVFFARFRFVFSFRIFLNIFSFLADLIRSSLLIVFVLTK